MATPTVASRIRENVQCVEVWATARQEEALEQAAVATGRSVATFVLESAVSHAERILADRRWFPATDEQYEEFLLLLEEPLLPTARFHRLWKRPSPFDAPFTPRQP